MWAIWKKEFRSLFHSVIGWLFVAAMLLFFGIYFSAYNMMYGYSNLTGTMASAALICLIAVPILTMRVLSEERKQKTDQLILTSPLGVGKIVAGKYLALLSVFAIPMAVVCIYPLIMSAFGKVRFGESYAAVLGFFLYGAACIALGVFLSSLTENQVIAAVLTFAALLLTYIMQGITSLLSSDGNALTKVLSRFDWYQRFYAFLQGTISITGMVYFISLILLFLFLTTQSIQKRRFSVSVKTLSMSVFSSTLIVGALVLCVLVNMIAANLPEKYASIDVTQEKLYAISDDTKKIVSSLAEDITIYVLTAQDNQDETVERTLDGYADLSSHIKVEYKDPVKYPNFYSQYTQDPVTRNSLIIVGGKRSRVIDYSDLYETEMDYSTYSQTTTGYDAEGQITSAIDFVTSDDLAKVYILEGHEEMPMDAGFASALAKANIETETINLLKVDSIPQDAEAVMILSPVSDYSKDDADKVISYLAEGGKAFITTGVTDKDMANFKSILEFYDVSLKDGIIVESDQDHYYSNPFYLLPEVADDTLTDGIYGSKYIFAPYAQAVTIGENESIAFTQLLTSSEASYNKADVADMENYEKTEGDLDGPFALGFTAEKQMDDKVSVAAVFTSEALFTDTADEMVSGANLQLFNNVWSYLAGHELTVSIPSKSLDNSILTVPRSGFLWSALVMVVIVPLALVVIGIVIWQRRRRR